MATLQDVINRARIPLNDDAKARYSDARGLEFCNTAIAVAYKVRPDLRFGSYATEFAPLLVGDTFPLPYQYVQAVADYVTGRLNTIDAEPENGERAMAFMAQFEKQVMNT